jgi:outer membrane protein assembly factor BamB
MATAPVAESGWLIVTCVGRLVALRASDGAILWEREVGLTTQSPPTVNGSRVFVPTMTGVVALDLESGVQIWTRRLGGPASEILATPDRIYVGSEDKHFYAIETATGAVSWRWRTGGRVYGRPVVDAARVYFVSSDNILRGLDRWSGAQRWKRVLPFRPIAGPVAMGQALLVAGTGATLFAYGARDGAPAGEIAVGGELFSPPYPLDTALPTILVGTHDLSKGVGLAAFTRSIEPRVLPMAPLPNATPVPSLGAVGAAERPEAGVDAVAATAAR